MSNRKVLVSVESDTGRRRKNNEDSWLVCEPEDKLSLRIKGRLYAVADGMGGAVAGELASSLAVSELKKYYFAEALTRPAPDALAQSLLAAHESIRQKAEENTELSGMGTTLTAVVLKDHTASICHVGDSRAYLIRKNKIIQLTRDQTVVANLILKREITPEQARTHPQRHMLSQALGGRKQPVMEQINLLIKPNDILILCSDGLYNMVDDKEIKEILLLTNSNIKKAAKLLVNLANERGGQDNITLIAIKKTRNFNLLGLAALLTIITFTLLITFKWL